MKQTILDTLLCAADLYEAGAVRHPVVVVVVEGSSSLCAADLYEAGAVQEVWNL